MDEYIDILNENNKKTGRTCLKTEAHQKGFLHASAHIWIFNKNIIIQKRAENKDTFPNLWDVSVAGHISAGETPDVSALREVEEEIGLKINKEHLNYLGTSKNKIQHHTNLIDYELHHIFLCEIQFNINTLKIQKEEVAKIKSTDIESLIHKVTFDSNRFVPHGKDYYTFVFNSIKNYKKN